MPIALDEDDRDLQAVAHTYAVQRDLRGVARAAVDGSDAAATAVWDEIAAMGWLGLHLPESVGGSGATALQATVVLAELGQVLAPVPILASLTVSATLGALGGDPAVRSGLASGAVRAGVGLDTGLSVDRRVNGRGVVLGGAGAGVLLLAAGDDLVLVDAKADGLTVAPARSLDRTQPAARVTLDGVRPSAVFRRTRGTALAHLRAFAAAQAAGGAAACLDMAVAHAKVREQFGRPIGSFQAVKHHCADMVVASELSEAVAWDAGRALADPVDPAARLAAAVAAAVALPRFVAAAQTNIQIHGAIGFTWEHDAHLFLRRALSLLALVGDRSAARDVALLRRRGVERDLSFALPERVAPIRAEARALARSVAGKPAAEQHRALVDSGLALPHLPAPWGRALGPAEQIAVEEQLADLDHPDYGVGAWVIPTVVQHATPAQRERWITPSLTRQLIWCQMFSEPGAGSDAAAIRTRGERVEGGWRVTGQKVWISRAQTCNRGLATVRTSAEGPKQAGITVMVVDLTAAGVEVRPLREASDEYGFGEVFLDSVFVPDDDVLGEVGDGWAVARSTLGNERVTVGSTRRFGGGAVDLVEVLNTVDAGEYEAGAVLAGSQALALLSTRSALRAVLGRPPGREGAITKLVRAADTQHSAALALRLTGAEAALEDGPAATIAKSVVKGRMTSIGGGTTEILKNLVAERILGLPR